MTYNLFIYEVNDLWPKPKSGDEELIKSLHPLYVRKIEAGADYSHHSLLTSMYRCWQLPPLPCWHRDTPLHDG